MTLPAPILAALMLIGVAAASHAAASGEDLADAAGRPLVGKPAPRLVVKTIDGDTIDLGRLYGRQAVYLKFWATWCVPCRQQMPHFQHAFETAGPDMKVIAVNTGFNDSLDAVKKLQFTDAELKEIDRFAEDSGIDLWKDAREGRE